MFEIQGSGFRAQGSGFKVEGARCRVQGARVQGAGFRVQDSGFRVQGSGSRVQGLDTSMAFSILKSSSSKGRGGARGSAAEPFPTAGTFSAAELSPSAKPPPEDAASSRRAVWTASGLGFRVEGLGFRV